MKPLELSAAKAPAVVVMSPQWLADALEIALGVTEAELAGTCYHLRKTPMRTLAPPDAPRNARFKATGIAGQLKIRLSAVDRAVFYKIEWTFDLVNGPWMKVSAFNSTRGMMLEGLTRGKNYFVRIRAVTVGRNRGPWSDIANLTAV